jgi:molecular chaperone GrpE
MSGTPNMADIASDETQAADIGTDQSTIDPSRVTAAAQEQILADLKAQADDNWDKYVRALAELDNVRKRAQRDVDNARKFALERFASDLLAVRDSLELGLTAGDQSDAAAIHAGFEATLKLLTSTMEQFGIREIDPQGEPFDPQLQRQ